jgi:hypothetical protein
MLMISRNISQLANTRQLAEYESDDRMESTLGSVLFAAGHANHID